MAIIYIVLVDLDQLFKCKIMLISILYTKAEFRAAAIKGVRLCF